MGLYRLIMDSSNYIFTQGQSLFYIENLIGIALLLVAIYQLYRIVKKERFFFSVGDDGKKIDRLPTAIGTIIFGIGIMLIAPRDNGFFERIKANRSETVGTTVKRNNAQRNESATIEYKFVVAGKEYYATCGITYDGVDIQGINVPNGHYKVIYNKKNPQESVMDFKAKANSLTN